MPLTEAEIARLEALGNSRDAFSSVEDDGIPRLRMDKKQCYFLREGRCSVHEARPDGCRTYPLALNLKTGQVEYDSFCPFSHEFPANPAAAATLVQLVTTLGREADARKAARVA